MATQVASRDTKSLRVALRNAKDIDRNLVAFSRTARVLSSNHPGLIDKYRKKWVVVYDGKVKAQGLSFESALREADKKGLPRRDIIVRLIEKNQRTLIL